MQVTLHTEQVTVGNTYVYTYMQAVTMTEEAVNLKESKEEYVGRCVGGERKRRNVVIIF